MKKITFMLALFMASLCSVTAWAAEREMPTAPATTLTSGGKYYLYNVDAGLYLHGGTSLSLQPDTTFLALADDGSWDICFWRYVNNDMRNVTNERFSYSIRYLDGGHNINDFMEGPYASSGEWTIIPVTDLTNVYKIQIRSNHPLYNKDYYWGAVNTGIQTDQTDEQQVRWQFIPANADGDRYVTEMNFYNALTKMNDNGITLAYYDSIYNNRSNYTLTELEYFTYEVLFSQTLSVGYNPEWWNDGEQIIFTSPNLYIYNNSYNINWKWEGKVLKRDTWNCKSTDGTLNAFFYVKEKSTFVYTYDHYYNERFSGYIDIFVDGKKIRTIRQPSADLQLFEEVDSGLHMITWKYSDIPEIAFANFGITSCPEISVSLKEPGSLGTEVLYFTDHIKNVVCLKVKGEMNDDDWSKLKMMSRLQQLDLSEAIFTEIPTKQFTYGTSSSDTISRFLHVLKLPEGVEKINNSAFNGSHLYELSLPSTLKTVGENAFKSSNIQELAFPDDTQFEGEGILSYMPLCNKVTLPKNLTTIPAYTFNESNLTEVVLPSALKVIEDRAFIYCQNLNKFSIAGENEAGETMVLPHVTTIGDYAFYACTNLKAVDLPAVKSIAGYAFDHCTSLANISLNADMHTLARNVFNDVAENTILKMYAPTVVKYENSKPINNSKIKNVTLQVPHYLVNSYKLDEYWYNAKIEGFDYSDMTYIPIRQNLTLNSERFGGKPAIEIFGGAYLKINGNDAQAFQNMKFNVNPGASLYGQLLNNSNTVTQEGVLKLSYYTKAKKWYFISLPFDLDIAKITHDAANAQYAIRSYDGATRAVNGATGNWKNIDRTTTIPAGTGFIFQTNVDTWSTFFAAEGSENLAISTDEFEKTLEVNASTENSHKGWNLVGNPYQCFYNNHMLNFTAPITVWDVDKKTYAAYSITDDDYALRPNEAFFIQCPNEENNTISFPLQGRQLSSVINSQNAVKANGAAVRKLVDLALTQNGMEDKTRVVFNDNASMAYETGCDAGKFMSMEADVPQIYTLDAQANTYAINERPFGDGIVQLGIYVAKEGTYTFSAQRNSVGNIYLVDNKEGVIINLHDQDYTFQSEAGTIEGRFSLCLNANGMATGIQDMQEDITEGADLYDLSGRRISQTQKGVYVIRKAGKSEKVMVK